MSLQIAFALETFITSRAYKFLYFVHGVPVCANRVLRKRWKITLVTLSSYHHTKIGKEEYRIYSSKFWSLANSSNKFLASIWFMDIKDCLLLNTSFLVKESKTAFATMGDSVELSSHEKPCEICWWNTMLLYLKSRKNLPIQT